MSAPIKQAAIILLPSLVAIAVGYSQYQPSQPQKEALIEAPEMAPISLIKVMPYPEFDNLVLVERSENQGRTPVATTPVGLVNAEVNHGDIGNEPLALANRTAETVPADSQPAASTQSDLAAKSPASGADGVEFEELDLSSLSPELAKQIQDAFASTDASSSDDAYGDDKYSDREESPVVSLPDERARFSGKLPAMNLQTHMFASNEESRWIKVNGKEVHQGEWITPKVQLMTINPRNVVISYQGEQIEMPALYEWRG